MSNIGRVGNEKPQEEGSSKKLGEHPCCGCENANYFGPHEYDANTGLAAPVRVRKSELCVSCSHKPNFEPRPAMTEEQIKNLLMIA